MGTFTALVSVKLPGKSGQPLRNYRHWLESFPLPDIKPEME